MARSPALRPPMRGACLAGLALLTAAAPALAVPPPGSALPPTWQYIGERAGARLGHAVRLADVDRDGFADVIVGAPMDDRTVAGGGRVEIFRGSASGPYAGAAWTHACPEPTSEYGTSLAVGDWNDDGWPDLAIGAPGCDAAGDDAGRVYVYPGTVGGLSPVHDRTLEGPLTGGRFGHALAGDGDVNGDGIDDLVIGAPYGPHPTMYPGSAYVHLGGAAGLLPKAAHVLTFSRAEEFGYSLAVGDLDGDGVDDVSVGAPATDWVPNKLGMVFCFAGGAALPAEGYTWFALGDVHGRYGESLANAGDVNGDGFEDLIVGAPRWGGRAFLHFGSATGPLSTATWTAGAVRPGDNAWAGFGKAVAAAGDVNADGYDDFLVSGPYGTAEYCSSAQPGVFLYLGGVPKPAPVPLWGACRTSGCTTLGADVSAGDVDGDGAIEILAGDPRMPGGEACATDGAGAAYLYAPLRAIGVALRDEPRALSLRLISPNPARDGWTLELALPAAAPATLEVRDVRGRILEARPLAGGGGATRRERVRLAADSPSGVYWIRLRAGEASRALRAVQLR